MSKPTRSFVTVGSDEQDDIVLQAGAPEPAPAVSPPAPSTAASAAPNAPARQTAAPTGAFPSTEAAASEAERASRQPQDAPAPEASGPEHAALVASLREEYGIDLDELGVDVASLDEEARRDLIAHLAQKKRREEERLEPLGDPAEKAPFGRMRLVIVVLCLLGLAAFAGYALAFHPFG